MQNANLPSALRDSLKVTIRENWSPPTFDAAFAYIQKCVGLRDEVVLLCTFDGHQLEIVLTGYVSCTGTDRAYLTGQGSMSIIGSLQGRESSTRRKLLFPTHSNLYIAVVRSLNRGFLIAELGIREFVNHCFGN